MVIIIIDVFHDWKAWSVSDIFASIILAMQANKVLLEIVFCLFLQMAAFLSVLVLELCPAA